MRRFTVQRLSNGRFIGLTILNFAIVAICLLACSSPLGANDKTNKAHESFVFENSGVLFTSDFQGGRLNSCRQVSSTVYEVSIGPENTPVNDSAWFAFQVSAEKPHTIRLRFHYENGSHRYWPKFSRDGKSWTRLAATNAYSTSPDGAQFELQVGSHPVWVAAQELMPLDESLTWCKRLAEKPFVTQSVLGHSLQGRAIEKLEIGDSSARQCVFIISRQHPPEISGAIGMRHFVETLAGPSELARRFRQSVTTIVVPIVNPDGVAHGHWRHNATGVDLNRDWGPFHQRETRAVRDELLTIKFDRQRNLGLFLDFHSTYEDLFYTQPESADDGAARFTEQWLTAIDRRFPNYEVRRDGGHAVDSPTSKNWVNKMFGIPAITYEFGDETDRDLIREIASGAAEEMMRLLLSRIDENAIVAN